MGIWFNKRGEEYYGETEKSWWKSYIDRLFNEHKEKKPIDHPDGSVTEEKLASGSVTEVKIANNSVTDNKIGFREVKYPIKGTTLKAGLTAHLSNLISEVDTANNNHKLHREADVLDHPDGSVTKEKLASGSVTTAKLGNSCVTEEKLASGSVTDEKIGERHIQYSAVVSEVLPATITNHLQFLAEDMGTVSDSVKNNKAEFDSHTSNKNNPHSVTKTQVGLGNVDNTSDLNKPISIAMQTELDKKADKQNVKGGFAGGSNANAAFGGAVGAGASATSGGGAVGAGASATYGGAVGAGASATYGGAVGDSAKATLGGAVGSGASTGNGFAGGYNAKTIDNNENKIDAIQLGTGTNSNEKTLQVYDYTLMNADGTIPSERVKNVTLSKSQVGLGNVDNTSDLNKPISIAMQTALDGKLNVIQYSNKDLNEITTDGVYRLIYSNMDFDKSLYNLPDGYEITDVHLDFGFHDMYLIVTSTNLTDDSPVDAKKVYYGIQFLYTKDGMFFRTIEKHAQTNDSYYFNSWLNTEDNIENHTLNTSNPHSVTKEQVGLGNVTNDKQATEKEFNLRTDIYEVDISKVGADNNILYVTVPNITAFSDLDGKVINVYTGIYSNNKTQTVWLNVNGYGVKPIRRVIPNSSYETSTYNAYEINRYTVMQLYIGGTSVYWVNPVSNLANIKKNPNATDGDIVDTHLTVGTRGTGDIGANSFTSGINNVASGIKSASIAGNNNTISGDNSVVVGGDYNTVNKYSSVVLGGNLNTVSAERAAVIGGYYNTASAERAAVIGGCYNTASGDYSVVCGGRYNTTLANQLKTGHYSKDGIAGDFSGTTGDAFIIGNGSSTTDRSNAFRVAYDGNCYAATAMNSTGADYAECFEWTDGNPDNEDRIGFMTAFEGSKIRFANENDPVEIIGVVSAIPAIVGDNYADEWCGKYLKDKYGRLITEHKVYEAEYRDVEEYEEIELTAEEISEMQEEIKNDETLNDYEKVVKLSELPTTKTVKVTKQELVHEAYEADEYILNPDYNADEEYIPRLKRKEYSAVGTHGKLAVRDDGTCEVGGFCRSGNGGIATKSDSGFYVMERIDDETVRIYIK